MGELALGGGVQTQSHYQSVRLDRDGAKIQEVRAMDSGVAPHLGGAGPIFLRPGAPRASLSGGSLSRLACGRSRGTSVCFALRAAVSGYWHAFCFISSVSCKG